MGENASAILKLSIVLNEIYLHTIFQVSGLMFTFGLELHIEKGSSPPSLRGSAERSISQLIYSLYLK